MLIFLGFFNIIWDHDDPGKVGREQTQSTPLLPSSSLPATPPQKNWGLHFGWFHGKQACQQRGPRFERPAHPVLLCTEPYLVKSGCCALMILALTLILKLKEDLRGYFFQEMKFFNFPIIVILKKFMLDLIVKGGKYKQQISESCHLPPKVAILFRRRAKNNYISRLFGYVTQTWNSDFFPFSRSLSMAHVKQGGFCCSKSFVFPACSQACA